MSITGFGDGLPEQDRRQLGLICGRNEGVHCDLSYPSCFGEMLKKTSEIQNSFDVYRGYFEDASEVFHVHGTLEDNGAVMFGIGNPDRVSNPEFAESDDFPELWIKEKRSIFYRNN